MIVKYLRGAPNSIIFFGANLIITIVWYSENGRALKGATGLLVEVVEEIDTGSQAGYIPGCTELDSSSHNAGWVRLGSPIYGNTKLNNISVL
jgi:hypothetical protein